MIIQTQLSKPKKIRVSMNNGSVPLAATRGPDNECLVAKHWGASIIRSYIRGWDYGFITTPKEILTEFQMPYGASSSLFTYFIETFDIEKIQAHYAAHMAKAFKFLLMLFEKNKITFQDYLFCEAFFQVWTIRKIYSTSYKRIGTIINPKKDFKADIQKVLTELLTTIET